MNLPRKSKFIAGLAAALLSLSFLGQPCDSIELAPPVGPISKTDRFFLKQGIEGNGIADASGKEIIPCKYGYIEYVGKDRFITLGRIGASDEKTLWNIRGEIIASLPDWVLLYGNNEYSEGLLLLTGSNPGQLVYIDMNGKVVVKQDNFWRGEPFSNGLAYVTYERREGEYCAFINRKGKIKLGPFLNATGSSFHSNFALLRLNDKFGIINRNGKFLVQPTFDSIEWQGENACILHKAAENLIVQSKGTAVIIERQKSVPIKAAPSVTTAGDDDELKWPRQRFIAATDLLLGPRRGPTQDYWVHRQKILYRFLEEFDLIGMQRDVLEKKLGKGDDSHGDAELNSKWVPELPTGSKCMTNYSMLAGGGGRCGTSGSHLQIAFDGQGRVTGWRIAENMTPDKAAWITDDVVALNYDKWPIYSNLVPKQDASRYSALRKIGYSE